MKQKAGSESSRAKVARLASLAGLVMILTLPLCASEVTDAAVWTVNSGQGLIECAEDPAHNIPRMEAGGPWRVELAARTRFERAWLGSDDLGLQHRV